MSVLSIDKQFPFGSKFDEVMIDDWEEREVKEWEFIILMVGFFRWELHDFSFETSSWMGLCKFRS